MYKNLNGIAIDNKVSKQAVLILNKEAKHLKKINWFGFKVWFLNANK